MCAKTKNPQNCYRYLSTVHPIKTWGHPLHCHVWPITNSVNTGSCRGYNQWHCSKTRLDWHTHMARGHSWCWCCFIRDITGLQINLYICTPQQCSWWRSDSHSLHYFSVRYEVNIWGRWCGVGSTGRQSWTVDRNVSDIKDSVALLAVVALVSLVKGSTGLMVGRSVH